MVTSDATRLELGTTMLWESQVSMIVERGLISLTNPSVVPELIQADYTAEAVAGQIGGWLDDPLAAEAKRRELGEIRGLLAGREAFDRAAERVLEELASVASGRAD